MSPRGRPAKNAPTKREDILHSGQNLVPYERLARSMMASLDEELKLKGHETRAELLAQFDTNLDAVRSLAQGFKKIGPAPVVVGGGGLVCHNCGEAVDEIVYTVPPYWPALKWLMDWQRQNIKEEPRKTVRHEIDPETIELIRQRVAQDSAIEGEAFVLPETDEDGVINLSDSNTATSTNGHISRP